MRAFDGFRTGVHGVSSRILVLSDVSPPGFDGRTPLSPSASFKWLSYRNLRVSYIIFLFVGRCAGVVEPYVFDLGIP